MSGAPMRRDVAPSGCVRGRWGPMPSLVRWRRMAIAASAMIVIAQTLAIANDVFLRQSDPSDVILLGVLALLTLLLLRGAAWARWTMAALSILGGIVSLAGFGLLIAARIFPHFSQQVPAGLRAPLTAFIISPGFLLLAVSVLLGALLDIAAAGMLALAPSIRSGFPGAHRHRLPNKRIEPTL